MNNFCFSSPRKLIMDWWKRVAKEGWEFYALFLKNNSTALKEEAVIVKKNQDLDIVYSDDNELDILESQVIKVASTENYEILLHQYSFFLDIDSDCRYSFDFLIKAKSSDRIESIIPFQGFSFNDCPESSFEERNGKVIMLISSIQMVRPDN